MDDSDSPWFPSDGSSGTIQLAIGFTIWVVIIVVIFYTLKGCSKITAKLFSAHASHRNSFLREQQRRQGFHGSIRLNRARAADDNDSEARAQEQERQRERETIANPPPPYTIVHGEQVEEVDMGMMRMGSPMVLELPTYEESIRSSACSPVVLDPPR